MGGSGYLEEKMSVIRVSFVLAQKLIRGCANTQHCLT